MHWVLQDNMFREEGFQRLLDTLARHGLPHSVHKVVPFVGRLEPDPVLEGPVIVMGSYTLARVAAEKGWRPGAFVGPDLDFNRQRAAWGDAMLNHDAVICPFDDVPESVDLFFLRPVDDSKAFAGLVTDWPSFVTWRDKVRQLTPEDGSTLGPATPVMVCRLREIHQEHRVWMVRGRAVTASVYKIGRLVRYLPQHPFVPPEVTAFAEGLARTWAPAEAFVMDVAETPDGLRVVEVNCLNAAGFYAADLDRLVDALEELAADFR